MVFVWNRRLQNEWLCRPGDDPRFEGLLNLSGIICEIVDMTWGEEVEDQDLLPSPSELVAMMRDLADRIDQRTNSREQADHTP